MGFGTLGCFNKLSRRQIVTGQTQRLAGRSAKQIRRLTNIKIDGLYWVRPAKGSTPQQVWCDMNTDGGGWMMIARTHPTSQDLQGQNFGWRGGAIGSINDFTRPYQLGFFTNWYSVGVKFSEFAFGNQAYSNQNGFGPYAYKHVLSTQNFIDLMTTDNVMGQNAYSTIKYPANYLSIYASTSAPWMQSLYGWSVSGTQSNTYWLRDVNGWSGTSYALNYWGMSSAYIGDPTYGLSHGGPWGAGSTINPDGSYNQIGTSDRTGGTSQVVLMVRE